jgi:EmrB/QacA subfamily drug resistance transporter
LTTIDLASWEADAAHRRRAWTALCVAAASIFLFVLDSGLLSIALPSIEKEFSQTPRSIIAWTSTGFLVTLASLLLIGGRLSDAHGRKRFYLFGVVLFGFGSLCTSLAPTVQLLITARVIGGAGAAFLTSSALALVMPEFPLEKRGMMIGAWGSLGSTAAIVAPTAGALLTEHISWRLPFGLMAPMALAIYIIGRRVLIERVDSAPTASIDPVGIIVGPLALGLLVLGLSQGTRWGWGSPTTLAAVIGGMALLVVFVGRCARTANPLLDLSIFEVPQFRLNVIGSGLQQIGFFAWYVTTPLILKTVWGWSTFETGVGMALGQVAASVAAPIGGRWSDRVGTTQPIVTTAIVAAAGPMWIAVMASPTPRFATVFLPASILMGMGGGICGTLTTSAALYDLPAGTLGAANSVNQLIRRVCGTIGVAFAVALLGEAHGVALLASARRVWLMVSLAHLAMCLPYAARRTIRSRQSLTAPTYWT